MFKGDPGYLIVLALRDVELRAWEAVRFLLFVDGCHVRIGQLGQRFLILPVPQPIECLDIPNR